MGLCILVYLFQKPCWEDAVLDCCCFQFVVLCWFALWYVLFNKIMFITKELHTVSVSVHWEEHSGHLQLNQTSWKSWSTFSKSLLTDLSCLSVCVNHQLFQCLWCRNRKFRAAFSTSPCSWMKPAPVRELVRSASSAQQILPVTLRSFTALMFHFSCLLFSKGWRQIMREEKDVVTSHF